MLNDDDVGNGIEPLVKLPLPPPDEPFPADLIPLTDPKPQAATVAVAANFSAKEAATNGLLPFFDQTSDIPK